MNDEFANTWAEAKNQKQKSISRKYEIVDNKREVQKTIPKKAIPINEDDLSLEEMMAYYED